MLRVALRRFPSRWHRAASLVSKQADEFPLQQRCSLVSTRSMRVGSTKRCFTDALIKGAFQHPRCFSTEFPQRSFDGVKLIILDKDGTICEFGGGWTKSAIERAAKVEKQADRPGLGAKLMKLWGYNEETKTWSDGLMCGTPDENRKGIEDLLLQEGVQPSRAQELSNISWDGDETVDKSEVKGIADPLKTVKRLKEAGFKVAVCTNDARSSTEAMLDSLGLSSLLDMVLCGDDADVQQKPKPHNLLKICRELGCSPSQAVYIGDTKRDVEMGLNAGVKMTVGVLCGVGSADDLKGATVVTSNATSILQHLNTAPNVANNSNAEYDYIIVGAGSAGCVLANRLTADGQNRVLLVEAGGEDRSWKFHMPAALMYTLANPKYNWCYYTEAQKHMNNRKMYWPRGKVLGGCSSHNAMVYMRGHAYDYDRWVEEGAAGWGYADILPYYKRSQTHEYGENEYRGGDGPLYVSRGHGTNPLYSAFIEAGQQAGYPFTDDVNGFQQEGFGYFDMNIKDGKRCSTSVGYLRPAMSRSNLTVKTKVMVNQVMFEGRRAVGIEMEHKGRVQKVRAAKEVVLSAGAINTPQLLMLSGVGDADSLRGLDIPVHTHLPGVGANLQDHLEVYIQYKCTKPITLYSYQWKFPINMVRTGIEWFLTNKGAAATAHLEVGAFFRSRAGLEHPDIQLHFLPSVIIDHGQKTGDCHAFQAHAGPLRSTSVGTVKLQSKDPRQWPLLDPNYLSTQSDVEEFRANVRLTREIFAQKAFDEFRAEELAPTAQVQSDKEIDAFVRAQADTAYHCSCSCKMSDESDPLAVVDSQCRVFGLDGLRVVDASIMPSAVSGNLNGPTVMMAEKASDMILGNTPLPKSNAPVYRPASIDTQR